MPAELIAQQIVIDVIGEARFFRFLRAGWLAPAQRISRRVLFRAADVHAALRRLERGEVCPPDQIASARCNKNYVPRARRIPKIDLNYVPRPVKLPDLVFNFDELV
jgi:hypothetical protein